VVAGTGRRRGAIRGPPEGHRHFQAREHGATSSPQGALRNKFTSARTALASGANACVEVFDPARGKATGHAASGARVQPAASALPRRRNMP
jgi:hypothetical protein